MKAPIAAWAIDLGAAIVNDVWGLQRDPDMARVVAERGVPVIIMHNRNAADPAIDIVADVMSFFEHSLDIAARAGIARERIVLDPGIGFGKTPQQSMTCIARLEALRNFGLPLLVGASRKRFIHSDHAVGTDGAAGRLDRRASFGRSKTAPRSYASMTWRRPIQALAVAAAIRQAR